MPKGVFVRTKPVWNKGKKGVQAGYWLGKKRPPFSEASRKKVSDSLKGKMPKNIDQIKGVSWTKKTPYSKYLRGQEEVAGRKRSEQCEICGSMGRICFDHNHTTGKFRGWICVRCNIVLGHVKDNSELLASLIEYLRKT